LWQLYSVHSSATNSQAAINLKAAEAWQLGWQADRQAGRHDFFSYTQSYLLLLMLPCLMYLEAPPVLLLIPPAALLSHVVPLSSHFHAAIGT
jgi:hypothetical protein